MENTTKTAPASTTSLKFWKVLFIVTLLMAAASVGGFFHALFTGTGEQIFSHFMLMAFSICASWAVFAAEDMFA